MIYPEAGSFTEFFGNVQVLSALKAPLVKMQEKDALGLGGRTRKEGERSILYILEKKNGHLMRKSLRKY